MNTPPRPDSDISHSRSVHVLDRTEIWKAVVVSIQQDRDPRNFDFWFFHKSHPHNWRKFPLFSDTFGVRKPKQSKIESSLENSGSPNLKPTTMLLKRIKQKSWKVYFWYDFQLISVILWVTLSDHTICWILTEASTKFWEGFSSGKVVHQNKSPEGNLQVYRP